MVGSALPIPPQLQPVHDPGDRKVWSHTRDFPGHFADLPLSPMAPGRIRPAVRDPGSTCRRKAIPGNAFRFKGTWFSWWCGVVQFGPRVLGALVVVPLPDGRGSGGVFGPLSVGVLEGAFGGALPIRAFIPCHR